MPNFPGPFLVEIPYIVTGLAHSLTFNCDAIGTPAIGDAPDTVFLESKGGSGVALDDAADEFWGLARSFFNTAVLASTYTLWKCTEGTGERTFISGGSLAAPNGVSGNATQLTQQTTITFRSGRGGYGKLEMLETAVPGEVRKIPATASGYAFVNALVEYVVGPTSVVMARDRSFFVVPMNIGWDPQNDKVFERRYRA